MIGLGILPDGTIIVGEGRDKTVTDYYYELLILKNEHVKLKNTANLTSSEYNRKYTKIREQAIELMKKRYPDNTDAEIEKLYKENWLNIQDDFYVIEDVTEKINKIIDNYFNDSHWKRVKNMSYPAKLALFAAGVKANSPVDVKNNPDWYHPLYIYDGEVVDLDAFGNIIYGALGAFLDITVEDLYKGASYAQAWDNGEFFNVTDDPRDVKRWVQGIKLYYDNWYEGN